MEGRFKISLSDDGASKLADRLTDNLKSYMGDDFVDDTLVKYVIVLLGNGRSKEEVKEDLNVFLGDNTHSFVTWLWDHLASNLHQYVQPPQSPVKRKPTVMVEPPNPIPDSDSKPKSKTRHNCDWKPLESHPPLRSSITTLSQPLPKPLTKPPHARDSSPPERPLHRKRPHADDHPRPKRGVSQATIAAPRRLLQFAVREAVATSTARPDSMPARKRLRSVVSTSIANPTEEVHTQRIQRPLNPMATAIRAVAEAAEDVRRVNNGNVFDRLSRGVDETSELVSELREPAVLNTQYEDDDQMHDDTHRRYAQTRDYTGLYNVNASIMDSNTGLASDSASDNEGYENVNVVGSRGKTISEKRTSGRNEVDDSLMVHYSVAQNRDGQSRNKGQEQAASAASTKHKIVNISVNVNTWKPPHYQPARGSVEVDTQKPSKKNDTCPSNLNVRSTKDTRNSVTVSGNGKPVVSQKENQKTAATPGHPLEDADLRTIFVNNVHFAATKDTLSRHFNKFGEVLKVVILTDAATGHPKGSAYVEFMRKEAAENALSLDGTSFMSRIIKVVKKSSGQQEASPVMAWPRSTRGSPFSVPRFSQAPFSRVFPGAYRGRAGAKVGARSMQWKRDAQQTSKESVALVSGNASNASSAGRGLTYVRSESKSDGNSAVA